MTHSNWKQGTNEKLKHTHDNKSKKMKDTFTNEK